MKQKNEVSAVGFDLSQPYMATGDVTGNIILWDLQNRRIVYRLEDAFNGSPVSHLSFSLSTPLLTAMSQADNSLKQFRINL